MVCRGVNDAGQGLKPGNVGGYFCEFCGAEVQVSPVGQQQLATMSMTIACNPCGFEITEAAAAANKLDAVVQNPFAAKQMRERGN